MDVLYNDLGDDGVLLGVPHSMDDFHAVMDQMILREHRESLHGDNCVALGEPTNGVLLRRIECEPHEHPVMAALSEQERQQAQVGYMRTMCSSYYLVERYRGERFRVVAHGDFAHCLTVFLTLMDRHLPQRLH